jgi:hypothetical protein
MVLMSFSHEPHFYGVLEFTVAFSRSADGVFLSKTPIDCGYPVDSESEKLQGLTESVFICRERHRLIIYSDPH